MERAGRLISKLSARQDSISPEAVARSAWPMAVGKRIAAHTGRITLVRNTLVVEVEDVIWQRQLFTLSHQIVGKIQAVIGEDIVKEIEFRIGVPRPQPATTESLLQGEGAEDRVLERLSAAARRKASA